MEKKIIDKTILISLTVIIFFLSFFILRSMLTILFLSFLMAYTFYPVYLYLFNKTHSKKFSSVIVTFLVLIIIFLPVFFLAPPLAREIKSLYASSNSIDLSQSIESVFPGRFSKETLKIVDSQFHNFLDKLFENLNKSFENFLYNRLYLAFIGFVIFLFLFYYAIQNLDEISKEIIGLIPLKKDAAEKFSREFKSITSSIVYGQILLGIVQGLLMGLFLFIIRFESTLFFTSVGVVAGILPMVGPSLVWIPVSLILLTRGQFILALILVVYGLIVGWFVDGFLRPYILSERTVLSIPLSFLGMVGGVYAFGIVGLIIGPLIIAYLILIINFYKEGRFNEILKE